MSSTEKTCPTSFVAAATNTAWEPVILLWRGALLPSELYEQASTQKDWGIGLGRDRAWGGGGIRKRPALSFGSNPGSTTSSALTRRMWYEWAGKIDVRIYILVLSGSITRHETSQCWAWGLGLGGHPVQNRTTSCTLCIIHSCSL